MGCNKLWLNEFVIPICPWRNIPNSIIDHLFQLRCSHHLCVCTIQILLLLNFNTFEASFSHWLIFKTMSRWVCNGLFVMAQYQVVYFYHSFYLKHLQSLCLHNLTVDEFMLELRLDFVNGDFVSLLHEALILSSLNDCMMLIAFIIPHLYHHPILPFNVWLLKEL